MALGVDGHRSATARSDRVGPPLLMRIRNRSQTRVRYGYFRIYILLRREGWLVNHRPQTTAGGLGAERAVVEDFLSDALFDSRRLRELTIVDAYTRGPRDRR